MSHSWSNVHIPGLSVHFSEERNEDQGPSNERGYLDPRPPLEGNLREVGLSHDKAQGQHVNTRTHERHRSCEASCCLKRGAHFRRHFFGLHIACTCSVLTAAVQSVFWVRPDLLPALTCDHFDKGSRKAQHRHTVRHACATPVSGGLTWTSSRTETAALFSLFSVSSRGPAR